MGVTRYWRYSQERKQQLIDEGRAVQTAPDNVAQYKRYLNEMPGVAQQDLCVDKGPASPQVVEYVHFPTQKPLELFDRIIKAIFNEGDMFLDPFAVCADACVAPERLHPE